MLFMSQDSSQEIGPEFHIVPLSPAPSVRAAVTRDILRTGSIAHYRYSNPTFASKTLILSRPSNATTCHGARPLHPSRHRHIRMQESSEAMIPNLKSTRDRTTNFWTRITVPWLHLILSLITLPTLPNLGAPTIVHVWHPY